MSILADVNTFILLEFLNQPIDDAIVNIIAAEVRVAVGGLHFDHALAHFQDRNIERAAAEVVDRNRFVFLLVQTIGQRRRRGFVDDALHLKTGDRRRRPSLLGVWLSLK